MNADCPHSCSAAAYLTGDLSERELAGFQAHLPSCPECRCAVDSRRDLLGRLRAVPPVDSTPNLTPAILAELRRTSAASDLAPSLFGSRQRARRWPRIAAMAALLTLCAGAALNVYLSHRTGAPSTLTPQLSTSASAAAGRALDWFCQTQESDGSWDAEKWGGNPHFAVALTALPTLALLSADSLPPKAAHAVTAATHWLEEQQTTDGAFGPTFQGAAYNQSIATLALLQAYRRQPDAGLKRSLDSALRAILARQTPDGGWGYLSRDLADRSITEWHVEALELASKLGWESAGQNLIRARSWLASHPTSRSDAEEPADSPSALLSSSSSSSSPSSDSRMDFYQAYFLTVALQREHDASSRQRLASIRKTLLLQQEPNSSSSSGSWPADDRWGRAGGRLYSTALASLSLRDH